MSNVDYHTMDLIMNSEGEEKRKNIQHLVLGEVYDFDGGEL